MTEEFAKTVNRIARAKNFEGGTYLLITKHHDEDDIHTEGKGNDTVVLLGIASYIKFLMKENTAEQNRNILDFLKLIIINEEERLFQEKEIEV